MKRFQATRAFLVPLAAILLAGCLGEPEIEDRWTRVDFVSSNVVQGQSMTPGTVTNVVVRSKITYRRLITGFLVTEVRASATLSPADVMIHPDADRERMARHVDLILANSVGAGRGTRAVTGWDHLIQEIDFDFDASVPGQLDSAGVPLGAPIGVFLVSYMANGTEIELANGQDSLVITPMPSGPYEVLHVGMELSTP